jgi:hypothetical protein
MACNLEYKKSKLPGSLQNLKDQIRKYNIGITTLQETRWKGKFIIHSEEFTIMSSGGEDNISEQDL